MQKVTKIYRVFDTLKRKWIDNNVYLTPDGELFAFNKSVFGKTKISSELSSDRYVYHKSIDLCDKNEVLVFEGDYVKAQVREDKSITGIVAYIPELSAYVILSLDSDEYYALGTEICEYIEIVGNVFDGYKVDKNE